MLADTHRSLVISVLIIALGVALVHASIAYAQFLEWTLPIVAAYIGLESYRRLAGATNGTTTVAADAPVIDWRRSLVVAVFTAVLGWALAKQAVTFDQFITPVVPLVIGYIGLETAGKILESRATAAKPS
jgi:hypothetical protein